jgi:hypothetical protein
VQQLRAKKILGSNQDGNHEFISLLACICADGTAIPPALIYQGKSGDLQDTWLEDFDSSSEEAHFAVSEKGWPNEQLGISWLTGIFDRYTKAKAGKSNRLLLVDGHSSHINLEFIYYCDKNGIILVVLPPHSTHRLQPLDVGIFAPLGDAYSSELDEVIQSSFGYSRVTKRMFWRLFRAAWRSALTLRNVRSAFASPGIHLLNASKVLEILRAKTPSPTASDTEAQWKTPGSVRAVRRTIRAIAKEKGYHSRPVELIMKASEKLALKNEILEHQNKSLHEALIGEKKRRTRSKPMGLIDKDNPGRAQFFSPSKVEAARQRAQEIEGQKEQEKPEAAERRRRKALERKEKAREVQERKETRIRKREEKRLQKEREKQDRRTTGQAATQEGSTREKEAK